MATWEDRLFRAKNTACGGISVGEAALRRGKQVYYAVTGIGGRGPPGLRAKLSHHWCRPPGWGQARRLASPQRM